jgi:lysocardiolipin and lysophospholipid acyltransferase
MHWRRFAIKDIPLDDEKIFGDWLLERWREKDDLIDHYLLHGRFPADEGTTSSINGSKAVKGAGWIETEVRPQNPLEFIQIFVPPAALALVVNIIVKFVNMILKLLRIR